MQATNENIREYQEAVEDVTTEEIANFTSALTVAFELLKTSRTDTEMGANCNQAIMIVTDGVPYKYEEIFKTYNFPHKNVRYVACHIFFGGKNSLFCHCLTLTFNF